MVANLGIMRVRYNAPVVLTFTLVAVAMQIISTLTGGVVTGLLATAPGSFSVANPVQYIGVVTHIVGHGSWSHLAGNFMFILLLGPLLEERHGSWALLQMIVVTALITGLFNALLFDTGLVGASGIVFMFILLGSMSNLRRGEIPLTFLLVAVIFLGRELIDIFKFDQISQFAHIIGGFMGAGFGFLRGHSTLAAPDGPNPAELKSAPDAPA